MCETCLTKTFASAKASVERNIERTPAVNNLPLSLNACHVDSFSVFALHPQPDSHPLFVENERVRFHAARPARTIAPKIKNVTMRY
jgi:hypothetical protein